ncbi:tetratricopeptide repeat protein [Reichenbachiella sp.]|uniref:ATP-binding protein n=1 Tax=Reichenbachiella sp. TaxID=2184521 RepID=UPI003BAE7454
MKKFLAHILIALWCIGYSHAEQVDSLKVRLQNSSSDTARVKLLAKLGFEYAFIHLDSSRLYCERAVQLADEINFSRGKADALNNLAISYDIEGNHEVAITYFLMALDIYNALEAKDGQARIYNNCGMVYQSLGDTAKSLEFHKRSLQIERELGDSLGIAYSMTQVAALHLLMKDYEHALPLYLSALSILQSENDIQGLAYAHWGLGELYMETGQSNLAYSHAKEAFSFFENEENMKGMSETSLIIGKTYLNDNQLAESEKYLLKSLSLSQELGTQNVTLECLLNLAELYKSLNHYEEALSYHEAYSVLKDQIRKREMTSNIKEIESKYNFERQQQEIALLNKESAHQTTIRNIIIGVLIVIAMLLLWLYWAYLSKAKTMEVLADKNEEIMRKNEIIEREKQNALIAAKAKADFLSVMSHEIRTPMNVVLGSIHILLEDKPKQNQIETLNMLKFSAENLLTLLNDILDLNKLESGKLELESAPFDINMLVRGIQDGFGEEAKKKGIELKMDVDKDIPEQLIGDPGRLSQVLNNLLSNSIKFTESGYVQLKVEALKKGRKKINLRFVVEDTGIGIEPEKQSVIFDKFIQADSETTRKHSGTGLGLSITKHILKLFGSEIKLKSTPGKGSKFSFKLKFEKDFITEDSYS